MSMVTPERQDAVQATLSDLDDTLVSIRRDIHAHPELSWHEARTTDLVGNRLVDAGYRVSRLSGSGLVADLGPEAPAYRVALRADLDALPLIERTGLPWASTVDGIAHACGHDVHTVACLGAGLALAAHRDTWERSGAAVRLIFQPAEEVVPGGALKVIDAGGLDGVDEIYGLHCEPTLDVGQIGLRLGPITAATDAIEVRVHGHGGHTSRPHLTQDLTFALAKVITEIPAILSRRVDPRAGLSVVWGAVHAGGAPNVIPATGLVSGTLRVLDGDIWEEAGDLIAGLVAEVLAPYAVTHEITHTRGVPPVVNTSGGVDVLRSAVAMAKAAEMPVRQSLGGEDFAWYLTKIPGALARLGTRVPGGPTYDLHQGDFTVDERAVTGGARVLAGAVVAAVARAL
ncbi:MAG: amidohydrolase [Dermatophilaceae bacterium]